MEVEMFSTEGQKGSEEDRQAGERVVLRQTDRQADLTKYFANAHKNVWESVFRSSVCQDKDPCRATANLKTNTWHHKCEECLVSMSRERGSSLQHGQSEQHRTYLTTNFPS